MQPAERARGSIYDLGYRGYEGPRNGRAYAFWTLYIHSFKTAFGLGRGPKAKIIPFILTILAMVPAGVQLGIAAVIPAEFDLITASDYYEYIQIIVILFVAAVAPEIVGRDQRNRMLPLYFSRPLTRDDYSWAKLAAMGSALLVLTLVPQAMMFTGNALAADNGFDYFRDNIEEIPAIIFSGVLISALFGSIGVAIGCQTHRRTFASGGILGLFIIGAIVGEMLLNTVDGLAGQLAVFLSASAIANGLTLWSFSEEPFEGSDVFLADLPGEIYPVAAIVIAAIAALVVLRRYRGIST